VTSRYQQCLSGSGIISTLRDSPLLCLNSSSMTQRKTLNESAASHSTCLTLEFPEMLRVLTSLYKASPAYSLLNALPMTILRISLVPAPISYNFALQTVSRSSSPAAEIQLTLSRSDSSASPPCTPSHQATVSHPAHTPSPSPPHTGSRPRNPASG